MAARLIGAPEERKQAIARATCSAIIEHGLHRANMRDIARLLGTTTGPIQHYFRSKEELLIYTKNLYIDELLEHGHVAGVGHEGMKRLQLVCESLLPFTRTAREAWLVLTAFNGRAIGDPDLTTVQVSRYAKCRKFFEDELGQAKSSGVLDARTDVPLEATALSCFITGLAVQVLFMSPREAKRVKEQVLPHYLERNFRSPEISRRPAASGLRSVLLD